MTSVNLNYSTLYLILIGVHLTRHNPWYIHKHTHICIDACKLMVMIYLLFRRSYGHPLGHIKRIVFFFFNRKFALQKKVNAKKQNKRELNANNPISFLSNPSIILPILFFLEHITNIVKSGESKYIFFMLIVTVSLSLSLRFRLPNPQHTNTHRSFSRRQPSRIQPTFSFPPKSPLP